MPEKEKRRKIVAWKFLLVFAGIIMILVVIFQIITSVRPPAVKDKSAIKLVTVETERDFYNCGQNWLKKNNSGLWELYLEGEPFERGVINGKLTKDLIEKQEEAFMDQIREIVPSRFYQRFLKYFIYWFNRKLDKYMPEEYKQEIYGISFSASDKYSFVGSNYQRLLNYHSAHDVGHALQDLRLVGCTSFGVWSGKTKDNSLLIGRNFDFFAGDQFAVNKIVCFEKPSRGYPFMMITWGGMVGTVSGMNMEGLTVTINAAKSEIPYSARTPISILAREILQYARNIKEAYEIAGKRKTFVSESILIGSAYDNKAAIIEKSPYKIELFLPASDYVVCANHFQSNGFLKDHLNALDMKESASVYRYNRVLQDISGSQPLDYLDIAKILRDQSGINNSDIGMGNEKAINQLIAHHSVIFDPTRRLVWVSTSPWQLGPYVCYDIYKIFHNFAGLRQKIEITEPDKIIPADPFLYSEKYLQFLESRKIRKQMINIIRSGEKVLLPGSLILEFISTNPAFFEVYSLAGDYYRSRNLPDSAIVYYRLALGKEIPRQRDKVKIIENLSDCIIKIKNDH